MDENQKKFIPQLATDTEFFHSAFGHWVPYGQLLYEMARNL